MSVRKDISMLASIQDVGEFSIPTVGTYANKLKYFGTTTGLILTNKTGSASWSDYQMTGYFQLATDPKEVDNRFGFAFRYSDSDNYFFAGFSTEPDASTKSTYEVYKKVAGTYTRLANNIDTGYNNETNPSPALWECGLPDTIGSSGVLAINTAYHLRIDVYGATCRMYIQNVLVYENLTEFLTFAGGRIGMESFSDNSAPVLTYVDNVKVVT